MLDIFLTVQEEVRRTKSEDAPSEVVRTMNMICRVRFNTLSVKKKSIESD